MVNHLKIMDITKERYLERKLWHIQEQVVLFFLFTRTNPPSRLLVFFVLETKRVHEISSSYHLTFFVLINLLFLDLRACEMHFLLPLELGNLSWLKVNTHVKD